MNSLLKYLKTTLLLLFLTSFLSNSSSHTFSPYLFEISLPTALNVKLNEEVRFMITVRNRGSIGDSYEIILVPTTNDIYVSPSYLNFSLESQDSRSIPISLIVHSILGVKSIRVSICSLSLLKVYGERQQSCFSETCSLGEGFSCITSTININTAVHTLGVNLIREIIIILLSLIIIVFLLGFRVYKHQKPYNDHHH